MSSLRDERSNLELDDFNESRNSALSLETEQSENRESFAALPPADRGRQAWLFLLASFWMEAMAWGFPLTFGLFEVYYKDHENFRADADQIPIIGTTALGMMYFSLPFLSWTLHRYPLLRRPSSLFGLVLTTVALATSSYANTVGQLILTQGVMYSIGGVTLYYPAVLLLDEWFVRRKGLAYGVMWAGSGAAGVVLPYLMSWLLNDYGYRTALRVWAVTLACLSAPMLIFLKPRIPVSSSDRSTATSSWRRTMQPRPTNLTFFATPAFWILSASNLLANLGFFLPTIFLPQYAQETHLSSDPRVLGATAISLYNLLTVLGAIGAGALIDRLHVTSVVLIAALGSAASVLVLWGLALSPAMLYLFVVAYGTFSGGISATWSGAATALRSRMETRGGQGAGANVDTGMVIATLAAGKGVGAVVSGPLSSKLLDAGQSWVGKLGGAYGTSYGAIITFTGVSCFLGGFGWVARRFGAV